MYPVNQFIMNSDSMYDIESQINKMEEYSRRLKAIKDNNIVTSSIWETINNEIGQLTPSQKARLMDNKDYMSVYNEINNIVQCELLSLVKCKIESSAKGKELLNRQLSILKSIKNDIINEDNNELAMFKKFKEYSKEHPDASYNDFIKEDNK